MTVINQATIPSGYSPLDSEVTAQDTFYNIHTAHRLRKNHNALLAHRCRRPIFEYGPGTTFRIFGEPIVGKETCLIDAPVFLSGRHVQQAVVNVYAGTVTNGPILYPCIVADDEEAVVRYSVSITVAAGNNTLTIPISRRARQKSRGRFVLLGTGSMNALSKAAETVSDHGPNWFEPAAGGFSVGTVAYIPTDLGISPRVIVAISGNRHYVDQPWGGILENSTSTVEAYTFSRFVMQSLVVYEERVTSAYATPTNEI